MEDDRSDLTPQWIEASALAAPALFGAAAGLLLSDLMHRNARRGVGVMSRRAERRVGCVVVLGVALSVAACVRRCRLSRWP